MPTAIESARLKVPTRESIEYTIRFVHPGTGMVTDRQFNFATHKGRENAMKCLIWATVRNLEIRLIPNA